MNYLIIKFIHILSSTILFGTGIGSAFYMFVANRQKNIANIYYTVKNVVIADFIFTTPAVIAQPITGLLLIQNVGYSFFDTWIVLSIALYIFCIACWLPVVWMQIKMRDMAKKSLEKDVLLPKFYWQMNKAWILLGFLALFGMISIFCLMIFKYM
jgi:uncharacterized membrane protein